VGSSLPVVHPIVRSLAADGPMLPTLVDGLPDRDAWVFEPKWDGWRCLADWASRTSPATFVPFDLLELDGRTLVDEPYSVRREALAGLGLNGPRWATTTADGDGQVVWGATHELGLEALSEHVADFGLRDDKGQFRPDGLLFRTRGGAPVSRNRMSDWWRPTAARAGLPSVRFHDLRHHFASALIASGCSIKAVQAAMGHESAQITLDTYGHLWPSDTDRIRGEVETRLRPAADAPRTSRGHGLSADGKEPGQEC
jgi:hypothetical protein